MSSRSATSLPRVFVGPVAGEPSRRGSHAAWRRRVSAGEDLDLALGQALPLDLAHDLRAHLRAGSARRAASARRRVADDVRSRSSRGRSLATSGLVRRRMKRVDRRAEALGRVLCRRASIGRAKCSSNLSSGPSRPGRDEVEDRPDLGEAVLDRRAGEREAALGLAGAWRRARWRSSGFLMCCASSRIAYVKLELREELLVAAQERVAGDDDVGVLELVGLLLAIGAVPERAR